MKYIGEIKWSFANGENGTMPHFDLTPENDVKPIDVDHVIELSDCPCDPRRRHERLGRKVAVI